ncbi:MULTISPECIES: ABC transporter permease [unclassified Corynebacterium]|uniref:ABC transporter permease n=1 Tax=Corynebacterium sp. sy017 TaxID=2499527 RepID=UPI00163DC392|nr:MULTISPECIES: ABC transporter permease [unclassified Corynebacterium]
MSFNSSEKNTNALNFPAGTFSPAPQPARTQTMVIAQGKIESLLFLRHGEQLLLSFIIPIGMLIALAFLPLVEDPHPLQKGLPLMLAIAAMSSGFTGQAISLAFDRRYGALKRSGASGVSRTTIVLGKILGVLVVSILQIILLSSCALLLGWHPHLIGLPVSVLCFFLGVCCFTSLGMAIGGALSSEIVLGISNLIWILLVGVASFYLFRMSGSPSWLLQYIPSVALTQGLVSSFDGHIPLTQIFMLLGWTGLGVASAVKWFKFD